MSKVTITFDTHNAAFSGIDDEPDTEGYSREVRYVLRTLGAYLAACAVKPGESFECGIRDSNGNTVGTCQVQR